MIPAFLITWPIAGFPPSWWPETPVQLHDRVPMFAGLQFLAHVGQGRVRLQSIFSRIRCSGSVLLRRGYEREDLGAKPEIQFGRCWLGRSAKPAEKCDMPASAPCPRAGGEDHRNRCRASSSKFVITGAAQSPHAGCRCSPWRALNHFADGVVVVVPPASEGFRQCASAHRDRLPAPSWRARRWAPRSPISGPASVIGYRIRRIITHLGIKARIDGDLLVVTRSVTHRVRTWRLARLPMSAGTGRNTLDHTAGPHLG